MLKTLHDLGRVLSGNQKYQICMGTKSDICHPGGHNSHEERATEAID